MKKNYLNPDENQDYPYDSYKAWNCVPDHMDIKFYRCDTCGQIVAAIGEATNPLSCCGSPMQLLTPGTVDASAERHVPIYNRIGHKIVVKVGSVDHPMTEDHHIEWICLVTDVGIQWRPLAIDDSPTATFRVKGSENVLAVYAYCNIHKLWCCSCCSEES